MRTWFDTEASQKKDLLQLLKAYKEIIDLNAICSVTDPEGKIIYVNDKFWEKCCLWFRMRLGMRFLRF